MNLTTGLLIAAATLAMLNVGHAFSPPPVVNRNWLTLSAAADDLSAQVLSEYMAKSHEEKLRAIKEVEAKKDAEINALKAEIQQLKTSIERATAESNSATNDAQTLASYQKFMEEYMINSQNDKLLAVREAELKAEKKFQERLEKLVAASSNLTSIESNADKYVAPEPTLFEMRNTRIVAAAKAGVSRWGSMEVDRAEDPTKIAPAIATTGSSQIASQNTVEPTLFDQRNAKVIAAANAGKSRWGHLEVERAKGNVVSVTSATGSEQTAKTSLYDQRNAKIVAAANAGNSRWGSMEIERAKSVVASVGSQARSHVSAETNLFCRRNKKVVAAANAGKSRWGNMEVERAKGNGVGIVGIPSTASQVATSFAEVEAVAQPLGAPKTTTTADIKPTTLFNQRNVKIVAAANVGKSRWGDMEVERAKGNAVSVSSVAVVEASLYDRRNERIVAAANAGKSRWGSMEVERAKGNTSTNAQSSGVKNVNAAATESVTLFDQRNTKIVAAANAGKSRWGDMEVERAMGSKVPANNFVSTAANLFDQRNVMVVAAANSGKSRWGSMEVDRARSYTVALS